VTPSAYAGGGDSPCHLWAPIAFLVSLLLLLCSVSDTLWTLPEGEFLKFLVIREVQLRKKKMTE
jgi:hypothetical protein